MSVKIVQPTGEPPVYEPQVSGQPSGDGRTYCAVHPTVETTLRCNKCGRYMCVKCAVRTPVGYRCRECVHQQQDTFYSAAQRDYVIAAVVSFVLSIPISYILIRMGFFLIIFLALPAGGLISEIVFRAVNRRRGRYIWAVVAAGIILGAIAPLVPLLSEMLTSPRRAAAVGIGAALLPIGLYLVLCVGAAVARLRYGK
jgi:hypothetical protein